MKKLKDKSERLLLGKIIEAEAESGNPDMKLVRECTDKIEATAGKLTDSEIEAKLAKITGAKKTTVTHARFKKRKLWVSAVAASLALVLIFLAQPLVSTAEPIRDYVEEAINHAPSAPTGLLTNEAEEPMNVEGAPLFDWWVNDSDYDEYQTAYEIRLYDGVTDALVWDSGKVASGGFPLASRRWLQCRL